MNNPRILIIEDHPLFATGIKELVEFVALNAEIVCAPSVKHAKALCLEKLPALIVTDLRLPDEQGQSVLNAIEQQWPQIPLVIMSGDDSLLSTVRPSSHVPSWSLSKAEGFEQTSAILLEAMTRSGIQVQWRPNAMSNRRSNGQVTAPNTSSSVCGIQLTQKQQMVMQYLASGLSNKEIARKLDLSPETIKTHLREIFTRMNVKNRTQAVSLYKKIPNLTESTNIY